jgi:hypothetical protein
MGALRRIYPAIVNFPLVLLEFEKETVALYLSRVAFVVSKFLHADGVLLLNPKRIGIMTIDCDGISVIDGLMNDRTS